MPDKHTRPTTQEQHEIDTFRYKRRNEAVCRKVQKFCSLRDTYGRQMKLLTMHISRLYDQLSQLERQFEKGKICDIDYLKAKGSKEFKITIAQNRLNPIRKAIDKAISGYPDNAAILAFIRGRQAPDLTGDDIFSTIHDYRYEILADRDKYSKITVTKWEAEANGIKWSADIDAYTLARCWEHKEFRFKYSDDLEDLYIYSFEGKLDSTSFTSLTALRRWTLTHEMKFGTHSTAHLVQAGWRTLRDIRETIINEKK